MSSFRKHLLPLATMVFLVFSSVLIAEGSHHHWNWESKDDCSVCSWQQTGSQSPSLPTAPTLFPLFLVFLLFVSESFFFSFNSISPRGRSPPLNLL